MYFLQNSSNREDNYKCHFIKYNNLIQDGKSIFSDKWIPYSQLVEKYISKKKSFISNF